MAKGTSSGLLDGPRAQSIYKHAILESYVIRFAVMTAAKVDGRRAVLLDGFAGRGRYDDGTAASAAHLLKSAEQAARGHTTVDVLLVERNQKDFLKLTEVADEYRQRGVSVTPYPGDVQEHLPSVLAKAADVPLFLFLDPCGANLPFATLHDVLGRQRAKGWPRTEALLNVSADLTRRAAGAVNKGLLDHDSVPVMNAVCGGDWWQETALRAHAESPKGDWESAAEAVVAEYAVRLGRACGMKNAVVAVRRRAHHQPVYHLVFLTRAEHGLWAFGDAASSARHKWLDELGPDDEAVEGMLFDPVAGQIEGEADSALRAIKQNLTRLASEGVSLRLVDRTRTVFGEHYGVAGEKIVRRAMRELQKAGVPMDTSPKQVRDWRIG